MTGRIHSRGVALVTALIVVAIAASLAAFVAFGQQLWLRQMQNMSDRARADFLERGALAWAATVFAEDTNSVDHLGEPWARPIPVLPVPGGAIRGSVEDAQSRFNLNNLYTGDALSRPDVDAFRRLLVELGLSPDLSDALLDWIDKDQQTTAPGGAEDIDYLQLDPPYRAANQPLSSIDELRLVRGFDAEVIETLRPYVTVIPVHTDVNVNTAPPRVVAAIVPNMSVSVAEQLLADRERTPFKDMPAFNTELQKLMPGTATATASSGSADSDGATASGGSRGSASTAPTRGLSVQTGYFLVMLDIVMGRHQRQTEALIARGGSTPGGGLVWHRAQALVLATDETE